MTRREDSTGASFVLTLLVLVILLAVVWLVVTRSLGPGDDIGPSEAGPGLDASRQQRTLADMRAIARANDLMRVDVGHWAGSLDELADGGYLVRVPEADGWSNPWEYSARDDSYTLVSRGADGRPGPGPPARWSGAPYDPDLILRDGEFTQAPTGR